MSVISMLVTRPDRLPSMAQMRQSIAACGDPLELNHDADLASQSGFLPVRAHGDDTGFEYYLDEIEPGDVPAEAASYGSHVMVARTGSDLHEARAALLFLRVAARLTGGAYVYDDLVVPPEAVDGYLDNNIKIFDAMLA